MHSDHISLLRSLASFVVSQEGSFLLNLRVFGHGILSLSCNSLSLSDYILV